MFIAAQNGHHDCVRFLLDHGTRQTPESSGWTPLFAAAFFERTEISRILLEANACHEANNKGKTPLHAARSTKLVELLIEYGADPTLKDNVRTMKVSS